MKLSKLKVNPNNPQKFDDLSKLENSIKEFPKMMSLRPLIYDPLTMFVLGGNKRLICLQNMKFKEISDNWVVSADELTEEEKKRFILADNIGFGEWDLEMLEAEFADVDIEALGIDTEALGIDVDVQEEQNKKLSDIFIIPPFSVLDTKKGYWINRKEYWSLLINDNGESRDTVRVNSNSGWDGAFRELNETSILDPVLAEIINNWFCIPNGKTFDCFAGDSVFGYVSDSLGNTFTGIELRKEQTDLNNKRLKGSKSKYICDDGQNILNHIKENSQDLLFSCPPYFDLEVYSDLPNDASNQKEYIDFIQILTTAFSNALKCLKDNRFVVITVGDIRNKNGFYYNFIADIKQMFINNGALLYNELILLDRIGNAQLRAESYMITRKNVKIHQNILVFFKGDPKRIKNIYPKLDFSNLEINESSDV